MHACTRILFTLRAGMQSQLSWSRSQILAVLHVQHMQCVYDIKCMYTALIHNLGFYLDCSDQIKTNT